MHKYLLAAGAVAALALMAATAGGAGTPPPASPTSIQTIQCTTWLPASSGCGFPLAAVYNDVGWYSSSSYARRTQTGWARDAFSSCLPSDLKVTTRYVRQNGSVMWSYDWGYGSCGGDVGADSGQTYVKVELLLQRSCYPVLMRVGKRVRQPDGLVVLVLGAAAREGAPRGALSLAQPSRSPTSRRAW